MDDNSLTYPNAEIVVPAVEHQFWMDDGEMSRAPKGRMEGNFKMCGVSHVRGSERVKTYEWGKEVIPGVNRAGHARAHARIPRS